MSACAGRVPERVTYLEANGLEEQAGRGGCSSQYRRVQNSLPPGLESRAAGHCLQAHLLNSQ